MSYSIAMANFLLTTYRDREWGGRVHSLIFSVTFATTMCEEPIDLEGPSFM